MHSSPRTILHIDMDAFFASVEQRDNPLLRGKPVIVGAKPGTRGVVSAASYEARKFGVHSAMPVSEAVRRCPHGEFVPPRMQVYGDVSRAIMAILHTFSPVVEQVSVDEAFLDLSGTERLWGSVENTARRIMQQIESQQKITASIGIAPNKFLAKIASDRNKPRGLTIAPAAAGDSMAWLAPLPVGTIWGVGKKTSEVFARYSIRTIHDLQQMKLEQLRALFGSEGWSFYDLARGIDERPVTADGSAKSISREVTFEHDCADRAVLKQTLHELAADVSRSCRSAGLCGRTVFLTYRTADFSRYSRQRKLPEPVRTCDPLYKAVCTLLDKEDIPGHLVRLIGCGVTDFVEAAQLSLFDQEAHDRAETNEAAMDLLREKFGEHAARFGREITAPAAARHLPSSQS